MADKKQNNRRNRNNDEDYNPKFRKQRKKVCPLCADKNLVLDYNILLYYHIHKINFYLKKLQIFYHICSFYF